MEPQPTLKTLLDQVRDALRLKHYSCRTEQAYVGWITRYVLFHGKRHPNEMGAPEVEASRSVTHLAVEEHIAASTQNQAFSALLFLHREVLHKDLGPVDALRVKRPKRCPPERENHHDLYTRPQPRRLGRPQPAGLADNSTNSSSITSASRGPTFSIRPSPSRSGPLCR